MGHERVLDVMGVPVELTLTGAGMDELVGAVDDTWRRCIALADGAGVVGADATRRVSVVLDPDASVVAAARAEDAVAGTTLLVVMDELTTRLVREGLEQVVGDRWLLHACALADPASGATVVLVAASGTGKTTASRTLSSTLGYVTDETAVVERDGTMTPFPKPLSLLVDGTRPKRQVSPDELSMLESPAAPWLARVALLSRDPDATEVRVEEVPTVEALAFLAEQTSSLHLLESPLSTVAQILHARGGLRRLVYAESADLAPVLAGWVADAERAGRPERVEALVADRAPSTRAAGSPIEPGRVRRTPVLDEYVEDGLMAVFVSSRVLALSPMATLLLLAVADAGDEGMEVSELEAYLVSEVGLPDGMSATEALAPLLDDLVTHGLLERA